MSKTKINRSYPDDQFRLKGYSMYHRDRTKGGGEAHCLFLYIHSVKEIEIAQDQKEAGSYRALMYDREERNIVLALYRPPKQSKGNNRSKYLQNVEEEMNDLFQWSCLQKQGIVILGDLNMDRLKPGQGEEKMLRDLEEVYNLSCLITKPSRVTMHSCTLLDVLLTNSPKLFNRCRVYNPEISDLYMIYGKMKEKACKCKPSLSYLIKN